MYKNYQKKLQTKNGPKCPLGPSAVALARQSTKWSRQKYKYQYRDHLVGRLTTSPEETQKDDRTEYGSEEWVELENKYHRFFNLLLNIIAMITNW